MPASKATLNSSLAAPPLPGYGSQWAVLIDIDGTLLKFADDPLAARVAPSLLVLLHDLHRALKGALGLVSSRGLADIDKLFGRTQWAAAGLHGLELRHADGSFRRKDLALASQPQMRNAAVELAAKFGGLQLEDKQQVVVLHCGQDEEKLSALHAAARRLLPQLPGYELQPGKQMLAFKPTGMDKGQAVRELLRHAPFVDCRPVYLGDDLTDEHAFMRINRARGISVRVGDREPSQAHYTVSGPEAAEKWLHHVLVSLVYNRPRKHSLCPS